MSDLNPHTRTDVTYWVETPTLKQLCQSERDAISYRDKFVPEGVVTKHTSVITYVEETISDPNETNEHEKLVEQYEQLGNDAIRCALSIKYHIEKYDEWFPPSVRAAIDRIIEADKQWKQQKK